MSTASNTIKISKCDNQLVMYAVSENASYQICNIQSGYNNPVDVTIALSAGPVGTTVEANGVTQPLNVSGAFTLPAGQYSLVYTGLNWGGPYNFDFEFNGQTYSLPEGNGKSGAVWNLGNLDITFTV
jgi:hypothetical protein